MRFRVPLLAFLLLVSLSACAKEEAITPVPAPKKLSQYYTPRPAAPLGLYVSMYLAQGGFLPVKASLEGVDSTRRLFTVDPEQFMDETFSLLEEYGSVLGIDIADLLNRSDDRPTTLTEYTKGLTNITERARRRKEELEAFMEESHTQLNDTQEELREIQRQVQEAIDQQDYATAGGLQKELAALQAKEAKLESDEERTRDLVDTFEQLLELGDRRRDAIEKNREVLIAGLKVVDVPGIDDLGIILPGEESARSRPGRSESDPYGFGTL